MSGFVFGAPQPPVQNPSGGVGAALPASTGYFGASNPTNPSGFFGTNNPAMTSGAPMGVPASGTAASQATQAVCSFSTHPFQYIQQCLDPASPNYRFRVSSMGMSGS